MDSLDVDRYLHDLNLKRMTRQLHILDKDISLEDVLIDAMNALELFYILRRAFEEDPTGGGEFRTEASPS